MFTWIPIHEEATRKVLGYHASPGDLLATLREMDQQGLKVISLEDKDASGQPTPLAEIDPFNPPIALRGAFSLKKNGAPRVPWNA